MEKFCLNNIIENNEQFRKEEQKAQLIHDLRKKGIIPIIRDNRLFVYHVESNENVDEMKDYCDKNFFDVYNRLYLDNQEFRVKLCKSSYISEFKNMIEFHQASPSEIWNFFDLDNEEARKKFVSRLPQEIQKSALVDLEGCAKSYTEETFKKLAEEVVPNYVTCVFKRSSKLSKIISFVHYDNYYNLDWIMQNLYQFLYSRNISFSVGLNILEKEEDKIALMNFTNIEKNLSEEDKISVINKILNAFNVNCVYSEDIDKVPKFLIECITKSKDIIEIIVQFANHNTKLLEDSEISDVLHKISSPKIKILKR